MRLYIAGPITGILMHNRPAFDKAGERLDASGYRVCSPFENGLDIDATWEQHMRADIRLLLDCDGVALLNGWDESKGARLEESIAYQLGMPRRAVDEWIREVT